MSKQQDFLDAVQYLEMLTYKVKQFPNYQLQVNGVNYWAGTDKWFDPSTAKGGYSFNEFMAYLHESETPKLPKTAEPLVLSKFEVALIEFIRNYPSSPVNDEFGEEPAPPPWDL